LITTTQRHCRAARFAADGLMLIQFNGEGRTNGAAHSFHIVPRHMGKRLREHGRSMANEVFALLNIFKPLRARSLGS
jgi:hypothetical protein